jgi:hypothetical protein
MECSTWFSELPDDLKEEALSYLPAESFCRYRGVCKEWNALISSTKFVTNDWLAAPPNRKPWLVFCQDPNLLSCMAYNFFTNTWKRFSFDFLKNGYELWIHGSAAGLFLTSGSISAYTVSNPLTRKSLELPRINTFTTIKAMTIVAVEGQGHNGETYKVIAVTMLGNEQRVEIYDSCLKSWTTAGHLPRNLWFFQARIVISEDFLYYHGIEVDSFTRCIVAFSVQNGTSIFVPLPLHLQGESYNNRCDVLFTCGSRVLLGTSKPDVIIIWELEKPRLGLNNLEVREIARMPPSVLEDLKRKEGSSFDSFKFSFEGMRDMVYIRNVNEVLVYNLSTNIWKWLPRRSDRGPNLDFIPDIFTFEPRPDMKV